MAAQNNTASVSADSLDAPRLNQRLVMFPMWFFQGYLTITVFIFAFGPWPWPVPDPWLLYSFLFCAQIALWLGYKTGLKYQNGSYFGRFEVVTLVKVSLVLNIIWIIPSFMLRLGIEHLDFDTIMTAIATGFIDPADMYKARIAAQNELESTPFFGYIALLIAPILWLIVPLGVFYWNKLNRLTRVSFVFFVIADLLSWVAIGTNKGIADFVVLMPWLLIARNPELITHIKPANILKFIFITLVGLTLLYSFFIIGMSGRAGGSIPTYMESANIEINKNNWMVSLLPPEGQGAVAATTSYLVQGYYGLSLAIQEPFEFCYGVGNSYYLTGLAKQILGVGNVTDRTYPARIEKYGWDSIKNWHSFYTWIASDFSFPGTIVVVFLIGRLFAMVWMDVIRKVNPFAVALFALLIIMLFYFPANNQVFAFSGTANSFFVLFVCWIITRKRNVILKK
jgi:hypothetical protein